MGKKDLIAAMIAGGDGVTVVQEGSGLQVAFAFSGQLVNKMQAVPDAKFDKVAGAWNVPMDSAEKLVEVVDDMRDFVRNNGVQVKDMEGGGKRVLFDYNKAMTQEIGAVNGASFDKPSRSWLVAADSKALVTAEGQTSYLDMAVNKMRGIGIETTKDAESIKDLAAQAAKATNAEPGIHYPQPGQSYSGPIVANNGNFAAQHTNTKDGVAFMVIHNLSETGDMFKGQSFRVDYDANRHVDVRSAELFAKQQAERATLEAAAGKLVDGASVKNASIKDGNKYTGTVMGATPNMILLSGGRAEFSIHRRDVLDGAEINKDAKLDIAYKGGKGHVVDKAKQQESKGAAR